MLSRNLLHSLYCIPAAAGLLSLCTSHAGAATEASSPATRDAAGAATQTASPIRELKTGALRAEVMDPNHPDRYNRGVRFTPLAAVLQAHVEGHRFFYSPAQHDPIHDHGGLASEFDLVAPGDPDEWMPPGYAEAKVGEGFLKVGVGVLQKQSQRYSLFQQPKLLAEPTTRVQWRADGADFAQTCEGVRGYAYTLSASVGLQDRELVVDWRLKNTGTRPFTTRQYTHNFLRFDDLDVGPGYSLEFPYDFVAQGLLAQQQQVGREIRFLQRIPTWLNAVVPWPGGSQPSVCTLRHRGAGLAIRCETSLPSLRTAIHARSAYVSPEQFIELKLAPGEEAKWRRRYLFELP